MDAIWGFMVLSAIGTLFCAAVIGVYADSAKNPLHAKPQWTVAAVGGIVIALVLQWII